MGLERGISLRLLPTPRLLALLLAIGLAIGLVWLWVGFAVLAGALTVLTAMLVLLDSLRTPGPGEFVARRHCEDKLSLGADNLVILVLDNRSRWPARGTLRDVVPLGFQPRLVMQPITVPAQGETRVRYTVRPPKRGDYQFGNAYFRLRSAWGLYERQIRFRLAQPVKVYPNLLDLRRYSLLARRGMLQEIGLRNARRFGTGTEFERLRDYQPDDEFRRINWKATARRHRPVTIEYETERSQHVLILIEAGRMMGAPVGELTKLDYAINAALLLAHVARERGDKVGLLVFTDRVRAYLPPKQTRSHFLAMIDALYRVAPEPVEPDYAAALQYLAIKHRRRAFLVLFTDLALKETSQELVSHLALAAHRHLPACVTVSDPTILALAEQMPDSSVDLYEKAVAQRVRDERREILEGLARRQVLGIDLPPEQLTPALINRYLELKAHGRL